MHNTDGVKLTFIHDTKHDDGYVGFLLVNVTCTFVEFCRAGVDFNRVASWFILRPKIPIGYVLEGLGMDIVGIFYAIWYILLSFGIIYDHLLTLVL
jgi:hypothetical protein